MDRLRLRVEGLRVKGLLAVVILFFFLASCTMSKAYRQEYRYWTSGANVYSFETFDVRILWKATYLSPEFRSAARKQVDEWKHLTWGNPGDYSSYLSDTDVGSFLVSIYTPRGYPPINAEADHFWDFTLDLPTGESIVPSSIETVTVTEREKRLFPYINRWSTFYRVKFSVISVERPFYLTLRSAGGTSSIKWRESEVLPECHSEGGTTEESPD